MDEENRAVRREREVCGHDHGHEIVLAEAAAYCDAHGLRFTAVRRAALDILLRAHRVMGAYDLLAHLEREGFNAQPPVAYRALDFLVSAGFVHRIERLNAYVACTHPGQTHSPAFLICRQCNKVEEAHASPSRGQLGQTAREVGFRIERTVVEAMGVCAACAGSAEA